MTEPAPILFVGGLLDGQSFAVEGDYATLTLRDGHESLPVAFYIYQRRTVKGEGGAMRDVMVHQPKNG
jgi:hypothetical protein